MKPTETETTKDQITYIGSGADGRVAVNRNRVYYSLKPRLDLRNHSPMGFAWGYGGSGPAQLSLAILADYFDDEKVGDLLACALYQDFKWQGLFMCQQSREAGIVYKTVAELRKLGLENPCYWKL